MNLKKENQMAGMQEMGLSLMMLAASLIIAILFQGFVLCKFDTTHSFDDVTYLDSYTQEDSEIVLQRGPAGRLQLLEYQKNWILPKYFITEVHDVEGQFHTAVETTLVAYPVSVEAERLVIGELDAKLRWGQFITTYGVWMLLPMVMQSILYAKWKEKH